MTTTRVSAVLSGVTVSFGLLNFPVDLVPAQRSKKSKADDRPTLTSICPLCEDIHPTRQLVVCGHLPGKHGPFGRDDVAKAMTVDGELVRVDPDEVVEAKAPVVELRSMRFSVVPAGQLEQATLPSGNIYRFRLKKASEATQEAFALLRELMADPATAFVCELVHKGVTKMYRGIARGPMITITELIRPSEFHPVEDPEVTCSADTLKVGRVLVESLLTDFDPEAWADAAEQRLAALKTALAGTEDALVQPEDIQSAATSTDLLALLAQSVADAA